MSEFHRDIRLLALDLDGTTFNSQKQITERTQKAIEKAIEKGVIVMPSTGRPRCGLPENFLAIPGVRYALTSNGGAIVDVVTGEVVRGDFISTDTSLRLLNELLKLDAMVEIYESGSCICDRRSYERLLSDYKNMPQWFREYVLKTRHPVDDLIGTVKKGSLHIEKILATFDDMNLWKETMDRLKDDPEIYVSNGLPFNIEINSLSATKGNAILGFAAERGISRGSIMACGDAMNDYTMLKEAGFAVAMDNAVPEIKAISDYVTLSNDDDGVADAIEKFIL